MGDILSRLVSLIPVFLAIIWLLRFLAGIKRRRQRISREQTAKGESKKTNMLALKRREPRVRGDALMRKSKEPNELTLGRLGIFPKKLEIGPASKLKNLSPTDAPSSPPVEKVVSSKSIRTSEGQSIVTFSSLEQGARVVEDKTNRVKLSDIRRKPLDSIRTRSPLARAMLWKIILDRPLALKETDE